MAIEQTKISLPLTRFVHTEKRQLLCEGTALLPDARFVGAKILHADAIIRMGSAQITADQLSVEGAVLFNVLYTGGDEPVGSAQAQYAFTHVFEVPAAAPDMRAFAGARVDSVAATLTGARVGLKAVVTLWAEGEAAEQIEAVQSLSDGQAQTLEQTAALCTARTHGLRRMLLEGDDELPLPTTGQVLYFTHRLRVLETQMQDGYARVAGELLLDAYHSGEKPLIKTSHAFPFDLDVPLEHAAADFAVAVQAKVQELAVTVTPADDPQGLGVLHVEGTLVCQAQAEQIQSADLLADAYAGGAQELTLEKKDLPLYAGTTARRPIPPRIYRSTRPRTRRPFPPYWPLLPVRYTWRRSTNTARLPASCAPPSCTPRRMKPCTPSTPSCPLRRILTRIRRRTPRFFLPAAT